MLTMIKIHRDNTDVRDLLLTAIYMIHIVFIVNSALDMAVLEQNMLNLLIIALPFPFISNKFLISTYQNFLSPGYSWIADPQDAHE